MPHYDDATLLKFLRGELTEEEQREVDTHLEDRCDGSCYAALERLVRPPALPGSPFLNPTPSSQETVLPALPERYELLGVAGQGGMGLVLRARDRNLNREVAVKTLQQKFKDDASGLQRFREEAHITAQLQHPGIPPIHEVGKLPDGRPFFVMKLVKGKTLEDLLEKRLSPAHELDQFLGYVESVCESLAYAHDRGVIHRDLKPSNVMIGAHGEVQVMDWGVAKKLQGDGSARVVTTAADEEKGTVVNPPERGEKQETQGALGSWPWMSPEQATALVLLQDERCDVFSLGAILCQILTGQPPYTGSRKEEVQIQAVKALLEPAYTRLDALAGANDDPGVRSLADLAKRCLAKEREERPRNADEVWEAVKAYWKAEQERTRQAELKAAEERGRAEKAEHLAREEKARADAEEREKIAAQKVAQAERRASWRMVGIVAVALLLVGTVAGGGSWFTARRADADQAVEQALANRDALRERAFAAPVIEIEQLFLEAKGAAEQAVKLARGGFVSATVRTRAEEALTAAEQDVAQMREDRKLLDRFLDITFPRETVMYQKDKRYQMPALAQPSTDEQFAQAFRGWGLEIDPNPIEKVTARFKARPQSVVQEVVAALDEWAERRRDKRPDLDWRKLLELADQLDNSAQRRQMRRLLAETPRELSLKTTVQLSLLWVQVQSRLRDYRRELRPPTAPVLEVISVARMLSTVGDLQGAERLLRSALAARPGDIALLVNLGRLLMVQQRYAEAIECYRAARALRPDLGIALNVALMKLNQEAEAEDICRDLIRRLPGNPEPFYYLGNALHGQKKLAEAEAAYRKALELRPDFPEAYYNLGNALRGQKKLAEAEAAFRKALELRPGYPEAYNNLGNALSDQKKLAEAEAAYRKALELQPNDSEAYNNLGNALHGQKKLAEAAAAFRKALELRPDYPEAYNNLGLALRDQKRLAEAITALRTADHLSPNHAVIRANLKRAEQWLILDHQVPAILEGKVKLQTPAEQAEFAEFCLAYKQRYLTAVAWYAEAFQADPTLLDLRNGRQNRFDAARAAALALAGKGEGAQNLLPEECWRLSRRARSWLRADFAVYRRVAEQNDPDLTRAITGRLQDWKRTEDLTSVRDPKSLAGFPEEERREWLHLWADVDALLKGMAPSMGAGERPAQKAKPRNNPKQ